MAKEQTILEVFIASPSDVAAERLVLEAVVNEFNLTWGDRHKVRLELVKWETHTRPAFGEDAQGVINSQIGDEYDIFLGIMWGRFGTKTSRAESGTEEEFLRAYKRLNDGDQVKMMFYFKDAGIAPSKMDSDQILKVQDFKNKINSKYGGLYCQFETTDDFQTKVRIHLSKIVQEWLDANSGVISSKTVVKSDEHIPHDYNPLANFAALEDCDVDEGVFDLLDRGNDAMGEVVQIVSRMGEATNELGQKFTQRTAEAKMITSGVQSASHKVAKRIANNTANDINIFVKRMSIEIPEFYKQNTIFTESFSKVSMIAEQDFEDDTEGAEGALENIKAYRAAIESSSVILKDFQHNISIMPRMTTAFNQARRRAEAIMDDLLAQLRVAVNQTKDIEKLLIRLLETGNENIK